MFEVAVKLECGPGYFRMVASGGSSEIPRPPKETVATSRESTVHYLHSYVLSASAESMDPL